MAKSKIRRFLFDSAYQVVTWIWIAFSIGAYFYYLSKNNGQGVFWSLISLVFSAIVMIVLVANQHFWAKDDQGRPNLVIEQVMIEPFQVGKPEIVSLIFRNRGTATAKNITIKSIHAHRPKGFCGPLAYDGDVPQPESVMALDPDAIATSISRSPWGNSEDEIQEIVSGDRLLFVWGNGRYENESGTEYKIEFCFMYDPALPRNMLVCPTRFLPTDTQAATSGLKIVDRPYVVIESAYIPKP